MEKYTVKENPLENGGGFIVCKNGERLVIICRLSNLDYDNEQECKASAQKIADLMNLKDK
jgi:hypothetical protein